jgi:hypothetical protein
VDNITGAPAKGATFVPTYRVNYEVVRRTFHINVEANSKNAAAKIVRDMEESMIGVGKCEEIVIVGVEQYFNPRSNSILTRQFLTRRLPT